MKRRQRFTPGTRDLIHRAAEGISRRSRRVADRLERLREGIDQAHESVVAC